MSNRVFFGCMLIFCAISAYYSAYVALGELAMACAAYLIYRRVRIRQRNALAKVVDTISLPGSALPDMSVLNQPLPSCVIRLENGELLWSSPAFTRLIGRAEPRFETCLTKLVPDLPLKWLKEGKTSCPQEVKLNDRSFTVYGTPARGADDSIMALLHWIDVTELNRVSRELAMKKPVIGVIALDNYEELINALPDSQKSNLLAGIDDRIAGMNDTAKGVIRKYDRDRYLFILESRYVKKLSEGKFALLDSVRELTGSGGIPATLSIGLGDGSNLRESLSFANLAIDMALSRGGDQVVIKDKQRFEFFGGKSKELEKRTKVKSRVMANALRELVAGASMVFVMGHKQSDVDSVGAAAGVVALARKLGRRVHVVVDQKHTMASALIERFAALKEYNGVFIDAQSALLLADRDTLLIVVDTSRPEMVESPELLQTLQRIAVIDHHRRAATYIDQAALSFHEPYASSASELVCELVQYVLDPGDLLRDEAEGMLAGIAMDTKNFTMHTGVRTFEAATYLKAAGADTVSVKRLFQTDLNSNLARYQVISQAEMIFDQIAIAAADRSVDRMIIAQAADELLSISGVQASFVLTRTGGIVAVSGRSLGDINVQVIAEKIGGGGHQTSAGAQLSGTTIEGARERLIEAVGEYFNERG